MSKKQTLQTINLDVNKRLLEFRKKFVDKNQVIAAEAMDTFQSNLSYIEGGKRAVPAAMVSVLVDKFKLNANWLLTGEGNPQTDAPEGKTILMTMRDAQTKITSLERKVAILEANQTQLMKFVERMLKTAGEQGFNWDGTKPRIEV